MNRMRALRSAVELKFKGERHMGQLRDGLARNWNTSRREEITGKTLKRKDCGEKKYWKFFIIDPYKTEMILENDDSEIIQFHVPWSLLASALFPVNCS
jgi:hypothetical protein